jgi:phage baseplate assembly protein W
VTYHVRNSLERWEPRIDVMRVTAEPQRDGRLDVKVRYKVKSTQTEQVLSLDFKTGG